MKYFFIVQGEGRGHMTQAISLSQILKENCHEIVHVAVGKSPQRKIPEFFKNKIGAPVTELESPTFVTDKQHKSVKPFRTIVYSLLKSKNYRQSIDKINRLVDETKPDVIINFYDFLGGLYNYFYRPRAKFIVLAHQYLLNHPEFTFPQGRKLDRVSLMMANRITRLGADKILALSFQPFDDQPKKKMTIVPPLIRKEVTQLQVIDQGHLLVYMVNPGYGEEVERFHETHPSIPLHCFWDKKDEPEELKKDEHLTFHQLNDKKFIEKMAGCRGYVTTAGFESVCEAMYLGKPTLMIPVEGHYEQSCNAVDGQKAGAGIHHHEFDLSVLIDFIPDYADVSGKFRQWTNRNDKMYIEALTT
ncbi:MAG: glycosyltransferase family protein [Crocinitomicaceae bacterium]